MEGRVKFYKSGDGYGFIQGEDGQEYYFNIRAVKDLDVRIQREDFAHFDVQEPKKIRDERLPPSILKFINLEESPLTE